MGKMNFNKYMASALLGVAMLVPAIGNASEGNVDITSASLMRNGSLMSSSLNLDFSDLKVKRDECTVFVPMIVNGPDTLMLNGAGVYGRTRWYQLERAGHSPLTGDDETVIRAGKADNVTLTQHVPYQEWMNGSHLLLKQVDYGCKHCGENLMTYNDLAAYKEVKYEPVFYFQEVEGNVEKTAELTGRAFVDFKVNQTVILPDYRNNKFELAKIISTIDSVKNDKDITVTSISIKGTASPEGPYANNEKLAKGRTEALSAYVQNLYRFPIGFIKTSYEPVDWQGLAEFLESVVNNNNLSAQAYVPNAAAILDMVNDQNIDPAVKNNKIKAAYPKDYAWLLANVYPGLRHSDYRIEYTIRSFTEVAEIEDIMRTAPQKLNLNELYFLASNYETGSDAYNRVFETAVALFPNDESANLNAAVAAMQSGNMVGAQKYLSKAGNSPKAVYTRGVYEALNGNFDAAIPLVERAISMGFVDNAGILDHMKEAAKYSN